MPRSTTTWPLARDFSGVLALCRAQVLDRPTRRARRARRALDPTQAAGLADHRPMQGRLGRTVLNLQKAFGKFLADPRPSKKRLANAGRTPALFFGHAYIVAYATKCTIYRVGVVAVVYATTTPYIYPHFRTSAKPTSA